ncbi:MAG: pyridoxamine 5'-phosphate oxidase family protein [Actinomycetota bacterium]|nr:pyridoxamine 5'-phosphate oxidase family protein [Actinomycetota bacterium]
MATWAEVAASDPAFARAVRARFEAHRHKVLATLRPDGSPRISGIEAAFADGDLWMGMMHGSRKARDLQRDPRLALHSASQDPPEDPSAWQGDAKVSGRAVEVTDQEQVTTVLRATGADDEGPPQPLHLFRVDVAEAVLTRVGDPPDHLVIDLWRDGEGLRRMERS